MNEELYNAITKTKCRILKDKESKQYIVMLEALHFNYGRQETYYGNIKKFNKVFKSLEAAERYADETVKQYLIDHPEAK